MFTGPVARAVRSDRFEGEYDGPRRAAMHLIVGANNRRATIGTVLAAILSRQHVAIAVALLLLIACFTIFNVLLFFLN
eukprot:8011125-Pyramimonas_sp.AAC.1